MGVMAYSELWVMFVASAVLLGGSWVLISRAVSRVPLVMTYIRGLINKP